MQRRETFIPPEQPPRRPRRRKLAVGAVLATAAITVTGVGAFTATAQDRAAERTHAAARPFWSLAAVHRDGYRVHHTRLHTFHPRPTATTSRTPASAAPTASASSTASTATPSATASSTPSASASTSTGPVSASAVLYGTPAHPFSAASPWNTPISSSAAVDPQSSAINANVLNNKSLVVNMLLYSYGIPFYTATAGTPRINLAAGHVGSMPMDPSWTPNAGSDGKMNIFDPSTSTEYELDAYRPATKTAVWAVKHDYVTGLGDGYPSNGENRGPTGSGLTQTGGIIRLSDIQSGSIDHALSFVTSQPIAGQFRYPASQTDGRGSGVGVAEGMRVQLDPSVNVDAIPGITPGEKMIAKALQQYGAYNTDSGGGSNQAMGIYAEKPKTGDADPYKAAGFSGDWATLPHIPRDKLRVMAVSATPNPN